MYNIYFGLAFIIALIRQKFNLPWIVGVRKIAMTYKCIE